MRNGPIALCRVLTAVAVSLLFVYLLYRCWFFFKYPFYFVNISTNRKRLNGDQYKKIAKLKSEKLHNVLNKTHKLTDFFKNPASTSGSCGNSNTNIIDILLKKTYAQVSETTISLSGEVDNIEPEGCCGSNELTNMIVNETIFETDPVKWVINDEFRDYVAKNGFNQNMTNGHICY